MKLVRETTAASDAPEMISLCSLAAGDRQFAIDTRKIREVLGRRCVQTVPLAPGYIGGILPYRGEVLTAVSFRALLGLAPHTEESCVLVLGGRASGREHAEDCERFGLMVDRVCGVVTLERRSLVPNPSTLDEASRVLFDGAYRMSQGLLVQLNPEQLSPALVAGCGLFGERLPMPDDRDSDQEGEVPCGR